MNRNAFTGLLLALVLMLSASPCFSYSHRNAHPRINELSMQKFFSRASQDSILKRYDFSGSFIQLHGETVTREGFLDEGESVDAIVNGEVDRTFREWVADGGRTADEPEFYSSLRHFYDPKAVSKGKSYLTDHVNEYIEAVAGKVFTDPEMDAREWAIDGPERKGYRANRFAWKRGIEYMERAFAETDQKRKPMLFARAWRALGETMHLLADMTVPAHVRNDAHPYNMYLSGFRLDPYEYFIVVNSPGKGDVITPASRNPLRTDLADKIRNNKDIYALFHLVADHTNTNYFSADTVAGVDPNTGKRITNANGMAEYPSPRLDKTTLDPLGYYELNGKPVAHMDWVNNTWWNAKNTALQRFSSKLNWYKAIDSYQDVVITQAQELIPLATEGGAKLVEWFIPRLEVVLTSYNPEKRTLSGTIKHTLVSGGPYAKTLVFNKGAQEWSHLIVNGRTYSEVMGEYKIEIKNNMITCVLDAKVKLEPGTNNSATMKLVMGGFTVESAAINLASPAVKPPKKPQAGTAPITGKISATRNGKQLTSASIAASGGTPPYKYSWVLMVSPAGGALYEQKGSGSTAHMNIKAGSDNPMYDRCDAVYIDFTITDSSGQSARIGENLGCSPYPFE